MTEYQSKWDREARVGAMTRTMTGDVKNTIKEKINKLYVDDMGELNEDYRKGCAEWHWNIVAYGYSDQFKRFYLLVVESFFTKKIDPNKDENFKRLMRLKFSNEFMDKINGIGSQVPIIAVMDDTEHKKIEKEKWYI